MGLSEILSVQNARVKLWVQLLGRKGRDKLGQYIIEGTHLVEEAVKANAPVRTIVYDLDKGLPNALYQATQDRVEWIGVSPQVLAKCSDTETPQGIMAILDKPENTPTDLLSAKNALVVVVDGVQDPGNLGTIIRSSDAVGATGILLGKGTVDLYNPKTIRSTMGSLFHLPIISGDLLEWLPKAAAHGVQVIGTSLQATASCYDIDYTKPTWLVLGNEGQGMSAEVENLVTQPIIIPMQGQAESLNVAMAGTVLLFEASRQRII